MKKTQLSTPQTNFIEVLLLVADRIQRYAENEIFQELTLLQFNILWELRHATNAAVGDIKRNLIASSASLSQTLNRMERDNLIVRTLSKEDKRVIHVHITDAWKKLYDISNAKYIDIAKKELWYIKENELIASTMLLETIENMLKKKARRPSV
jgi:DNA-binding MarR family transcriptional regulator